MKLFSRGEAVMVRYRSGRAGKARIDGPSLVDPASAEDKSLNYSVLAGATFQPLASTTGLAPPRSLLR